MASKYSKCDVLVEVCRTCPSNKGCKNKLRFFEASDILKVYWKKGK